MARLEGKVAIVTGGTGGIGSAQVRLMAQEGATVVAADRREESEGTAIVEEWGLGQSVVYRQVDVTSPANWRELVDATVERFGGLDVLVNSAGDWTFANIEDTSTEEWDHLIAVNQSSTFYGMKHAIPAMRERGGGSIINISSIWGAAGLTGAVGYQSSKGGVDMLTKNGAVTYAPERIRVNSIQPGIIRTPHLLDNPDGANDTTLANTPMGVMGPPDAIGWATVYLASDEASFVTGVLLPVDGGYLAR